MTAPLENEIKIILTSIERGYHAVNLRSSMPKPCGFSTLRARMPRRAYVDTPSRGVTLGAIICGSFLISVTEYSYYLIAIKKGLESKISQGIFRLFYGISAPIDIRAETSGG